MQLENYSQTVNKINRNSSVFLPYGKYKLDSSLISDRADAYIKTAGQQLNISSKFAKSWCSLRLLLPSFVRIATTETEYSGGSRVA